MKKFGYIIGSSSLFILPLLTSAAGTLADGSGNAGDFQKFLTGILNFSNNFLIPFIIGIGFLVFVWGMFQYFIAGGANDDAKEKGKSLMIYATLGFVLIIVFWGIINLLSQSTGLDGKTLLNRPTITVPGAGV